MRTWIVPALVGAVTPFALLAIAGPSCGGKDDNGEGEQNCRDELDDDNDGFVDCDDPDCSSTLACQSEETDTDTGEDTDDTGDTALPNLGGSVATFYGEDEDDWAGYSVASGVDINADGENDIVVGAPNHDCKDKTGTAMADSGAAYVIFGPVSGTQDLSKADVKICGSRPEANMGWSVALAGDLTGDAKGDVLIAAPDDSSGRVYVFSGLAPSTEAIYPDETTVAATLVGEATEYQFGNALSVGVAGPRQTPVLLVGSPAWSTNGLANAGRTYLFEGPLPTESRASRATTWFTGSQAKEETGRDVVSEDFDGDGNNDIAVGALRSTFEAASESGAVYIKYHDYLSARWEWKDADVVLQGRIALEGLGIRVTSAGDFNDDGYADLLAGAHTAGNEKGAAYIWFGTSDKWTTTTTAGVDVVMTGGKAFDRAGHGAAGVGDVTADGIDDVVIGAIGVDQDGLAERGAIYLVSGGVTGAVDLERAATATFLGADRGEQAGHRVVAGGDLNNDNRDDVVVGAFWNSVNDKRSGAIYVLASPLD